MSEKWDSVTRIGSKVRTGGGAAERERVIKGKSALNAAQRTGAIVATEKKFGSTNTRPAVDGQHLTKVDRETDVVAPKRVGKVVGDAIRKRRAEMQPPLTQKELATKCNVPAGTVQDFENGTAAPDQKVLASLERVLGIKLRGDDIGAPKFGPKKK